MTAQVFHFINGHTTNGCGSRIGPVFNPATGAIIADCLYGDKATVDQAVQAAVVAGAQWANLSHGARLAVIFRMREALIAHQEELARTIGEEHGKTLADAKGEILGAIDSFEFATNAPHLSKGEYLREVGGGIDVYSMKVPVGVVGCITPFNFPIMVPAGMTAMAIALGNAVVIKPSERVPLTAQLLARLWKASGLPDGIFNIVNGDKEVVDAILEHPKVNAVSFVGSSTVGEYVFQKGSAFNKRVAAFTGAKNHMVVLPDADLEAAANAFIAAGYGAASQRCMAVSLLLPVGKATADHLRDLVLNKVRQLKVGPYDQLGVDFGPVNSLQGKEAVLGAIDTCIGQGGQLLVDGRGLVVPGYESGYFLGPTLFDGINQEMDFYKSEVFGPARGIVRIDSLDEAIQVTNSHEYGNGSVLFTRDGRSANRFMKEVESGMIGINVPVPVPANCFNFGGLRRSRFGDSHLYGPDAARFYTKIKTTSQRWPDDSYAASPLSLAFDTKA